MGKGQIISGGTDGLYQVKLMHDRVKAERSLARINGWITRKEEQIAALPVGDPEHKLPRLKLELASLQKQKDYLERIPQDPEVSAWCADFSENLSNDVGTIEINGDTQKVLIRPGHSDNAEHDANRDGQLQYGMAMTPEQWFYNAAMTPGWKKWMPTYRVGTLSNLTDDTCTVTLDAATADIVYAGSVSINEAASIANVTIEYMNCNGAAFHDGDRVIVEFTGQDFDSPKVIGFAEGPKPCDRNLILVWVYLHTSYWIDPIYANVTYGFGNDVIRATDNSYEKGYIYNVDTSIPKAFFFWDIETNDYADDDKKIYWVNPDDPNKIKHYLKKSDYPFKPPVSGDILSHWKYRTEQVVTPIYTYSRDGFPDLPKEEYRDYDITSTTVCDENEVYNSYVRPQYNPGSYLIAYNERIYSDIICNVGASSMDTRYMKQLMYGIFLGTPASAFPTKPNFIDVDDYEPTGYSEFILEDGDTGYPPNIIHSYDATCRLKAKINTLAETDWEYVLGDNLGGDIKKVFGTYSWLSDTHAVQIHTYRGYDRNTFAQCEMRNPITGEWDVTKRSQQLETACIALIDLAMGDWPEAWAPWNSLQLFCNYYKGPTQASGMLELLNEKREDL